MSSSCNIRKVKFNFIKERNRKFYSKKIILSSNNYKLLVISLKFFFHLKELIKNLIINFLQNPHQKKESKKFKEVNGISI